MAKTHHYPFVHREQQGDGGVLAWCATAVKGASCYKRGHGSGTRLLSTALTSKTTKTSLL